MAKAKKRVKKAIASAANLRIMGLWAYCRYCRNGGVKFEDCYFSIFGREPRLV